MCPHRSNWRRVSRSRPCPICGKPDWCLVSSDESAVICPRTESDKRIGEAGWLHRMRSDTPYRPLVHTLFVPSSVGRGATFRMAQFVKDFQGSVDTELLRCMADKLGLTTTSLQRLGVGWSELDKAWAFPMKDAAGEILGIRLRTANGFKFAVTGSRHGLFIPSGLNVQRELFVSEGPTDTAALLDMGLTALGRPTCSSGVRHIVDFARRTRPDSVVIVADSDKPGQCGANALARILLAYCGSLRVIAPPGGFKDIRECKQAGANMGDIRVLVDSAPTLRLEIDLKEIKGRWCHSGK